MARMKAKNRVGLFLTGGLGNQLFQFAAALTIADKSGIDIFDRTGKPRTNKSGDPEIFSFNLEKCVPYVRVSRGNILTEKSAGYLLRSHIWPKNFEKSTFVRFVLKTAGAIVQSLSFRQVIWPVVISDVGFKQLKIPKAKVPTPLLIGYFQSSVWPISVKDKLNKLQLIHEGPNLIELRELANEMKPIIVHVRRGDYLYETSFGLLGQDYYQRAFQYIEQQFADNPIWVFSDDVEEARKTLNWLPPSRLKFIPDVDGESAASLTAMRYGCAYVIANSTFSWWGAFLSETENPIVVAPNPWFIGQKDPDALIPSKWIKVTR